MESKKPDTAVLKDWIEVYENDFSKYFDLFQNWEEKGYFEKLEKLTEEKKKQLCVKYKKLFTISCKLLQKYLIYSGIYQTTVIMALKQAYYSEIVTDGQKWINLLFLFKSYDGSEKKMKFLLKHINKDYFKIFKNLNEYIQAEIKEANE